MADRARELAVRSGLTVLGEVGTPADASSVWRAFMSGFAVPSASVPDTEDESALAALQTTWLTMAREHGVLSATGDFLLSVETSGKAVGPWLHVRLGDSFDISGLGLVWYQPGFVASDLGRTVSLGVLTDEDDYPIFLSRTNPLTGETPVLR